MECRRLYSVSFYEYIYMIHAPRCRNLLVAQLNQAYQIIFPDMQGYARRDLSSKLSTTISDCTLWIFVVEGSFAHRQSGVDDIFLKLKISFIPHGYHWTALIRAEGFTWLRDFKSCHTECLSFGWSFTILHPCARPHPRLSHCASQLTVWNRFPLSLMQFVGKCRVSLNNRSGLREKQHTWDPLSLHNYCAVLCRTRISFEPSIWTYKKTFL